MQYFLVIYIHSKLLYLDFVLNAGQDQIIYDVMQSEEGGRFYQEQNRNMIVEADETLPSDTPENYIWMTLGQIQKFIIFIKKIEFLKDIDTDMKLTLII